MWRDRGRWERLWACQGERGTLNFLPRVPGIMVGDNWWIITDDDVKMAPIFVKYKLRWQCFDMCFFVLVFRFFIKTSENLILTFSIFDKEFTEPLCSLGFLWLISHLDYVMTAIINWQNLTEIIPFPFNSWVSTALELLCLMYEHLTGFELILLSGILGWDKTYNKE